MSPRSLASQLADTLADGGWRTRLRKEQLAPLGDWLIWLFMGGRGTGKTLAGGNIRAKTVIASRARALSLCETK